MNEETILIPVDFSDCSYEVVGEAVALARQLDARLVLVHVLARDPAVAEDTPVLDAEGQLITMGELLEREALEGLESYDALLGTAPYRALIERGPVVDTILAVAEREGTTRILMGTKGRRGLARWLHGSVAEEVIRRAKVPVTAFRTQYKTTCQAGSCSACQSGVTRAAWQLQAEHNG